MTDYTRSLAFTLLLHYGGDEFGKLDSRLGSHLVTDLVDYYEAGEQALTFDRAAQEYMDDHRGLLQARAELLSRALQFPLDGSQRIWTPTEMNAQRAEWAETALYAFADETNQTTSTLMPLGLREDSLSEVAGDLVCDLMHLCARAGADPIAVVNTGIRRFRDEYDGTED